MVNVIGLLLTKQGPHLRTDVGEDSFWQTRGAEYARKLFAGVDRHTTQPHTNYLLTDSPELAPAGVIAVPTPLSRQAGAGWWGKLGIFAPGVLPPTEKALYLDADNVVCGPLDPMLDLEPEPLLMLDDLYTPGLSNASALLFYPGECRWLWDEYAHFPLELQDLFSVWPNAADQAYIASRYHRRYTVEAKFMQSVLPHGYVLNARTHIEAGADYSAASLVMGSWHPKPHESTAEFYRQHWIDG